MADSSDLPQMRRRTEDLVRYYGELDRRIANAGLEGIHDLLTLAQHVETAVGTVASQEIEWMVGEVRRLLEQLVEMDSRLQRVRELKLELDGGGESLEPPQRRPGR